MSASRVQGATPLGGAPPPPGPFAAAPSSATMVYFIGRGAKASRCDHSFSVFCRNLASKAAIPLVEP